MAQNGRLELGDNVIWEPKSSYITPVLKSPHWLKVNERIKYKLLSLTYKVLTTNQPQYLYNLISVQPCHNTRSSSMVTLARPPTRSSLKITNRSFQYEIGWSVTFSLLTLRSQCLVCATRPLCKKEKCMYWSVP